MTPEEVEKARADAESFMRFALEFTRGRDEGQGEFGWIKELHGDQLASELAESCTDEKACETLAKAREGDLHSRTKLCGAAAWRLRMEGTLPPQLAQFAADILMGVFRHGLFASQATGGRRKASFLRDILISTKVSLLLEEHPTLHETRNPTAQKPSACSIVADALCAIGHPLSEKQVSDICRSHRQPFRKRQRP